jgi:hypothetical protein
MNQVAASLHPAPNPRRYAPWITIFILVVLSAFLIWRGLSYYRADLVARTDHPDYRTLRPAGLLGHGYGIVGTGLILTNLLYLARRRFARVIPAWMGSVKAWLDVHVITGLTGSLLILFHSAFQLRTPIATVTSVSLAIVVFTGLIGLYLYELIPKAALKPLKDRLAELEPLFPGLVGRVDEAVRKIEITRLPGDSSLLRTLWTVPKWILEARARRSAVRTAARATKTFRVLWNADRHLAKALVAELSVLAAGEIDTNAGSALMRSWRSLHRFLALLMIVSVTVHIGVAWYFGFRWIFSK